MTAVDDTGLDGLLREAATAAAWPATPDIRAAVVSRIGRDGIRPGTDAPVPATRDRAPGLRLGRALAVALLALLVLAGVAAALGFRLPGLDIVFVNRLPPAGTGLDLGSPIPLADARAFDRPRVLVPASLPAPDGAFELGAGDRRIVSLAYPAAAGQPTLVGGDLTLVVMAVPGEADLGLIEKLLGPGTTIEPVSVGGTPGWWIAGAAHEILVLRPDGSVGTLTSAYAGDTLVFARDGTLYRLESGLGREATIAIAESMR